MTDDDFRFRIFGMTPRDGDGAELPRVSWDTVLFVLVCLFTIWWMVW